MRLPVPAALALALASACGREEPAAAGPATGPPPSLVVVVTLDTQRFDHLGAWGYPLPVSPFLDGLAREGIRFQTCVSSSSHTGPAHASILTGLQPGQHGMLGNDSRPRDGLLRLPELFHRAGWRTAAFTSVFFLRNLADGFDHFEAPTRQLQRPAARTLDRVALWLREQPADERLFLWVHLFDTHEWMHPPYGDRRALAAMEKVYAEAWPEHGRWLQEQEGLDPAVLDAEHGFRAALLEYDARVLGQDRQLQRLARLLAERRPAGERALWIVTADHGEGLGAHGFKGHGKYVYNEQVRVPLLFWWSDGTGAGRVVDGLARHVDLLPTLAEILGVTPEPGPFTLAGRSLAPWLGPAPPSAPPEALAWSRRRPADRRRIEEGGWEPGEVAAVQDLRFKYILHTAGEDEFYDLRSDPLELRNLGRGGHPALAEWRERARGLFRFFGEAAPPVAGAADEETRSRLAELGYGY